MALIGTRATALVCGFSAVLTTCAAIGLSATPAWACSCAGTDDADALAGADAVFVGELLGYEPPPTIEGRPSPEPATWTFGVDEVFKGDVTEVQQVLSTVGGCGLELPHEDVTVLVFAYHDPNAAVAEADELWAGLCGATRPGGAPAAFAELSRPPRPLPGSGSDSTDVLPFVAGAAVVAAAAVAFVLHRRRRTA